MLAAATVLVILGWVANAASHFAAPVRLPGERLTPAQRWAALSVALNLAGITLFATTYL